MYRNIKINNQICKSWNMRSRDIKLYVFLYTVGKKNKLKISFNILYQKHKILLNLLKDMQDLDNQDQKYC